MKNARKALLFILCLVAALLLSACHADNDPWPAGGTSTVVEGSTTEQTQDAQPTEEELQAGELEETAQPGGSDEPGLNG